MSLFTFIKKLFSKAEIVETQFATFTEEIKVSAPEVAAEIKTEVEQVKKAKKKVTEVIADVEAKVEKQKAPKAKKQK